MVCEFSRVPVGTELKGAWMYIIITILTLINLLNYTDRFTIAGVLTDIQKYYHIDDTMGGFIQTMFMIFFIICSPICGYLGDRYNRKWVLTVGIAVWVSAVLVSSFIPANLFWLFLLFRGIVGVGEASYAIISPVMIGDMFTDPIRSRVLMVFYFATPFGCGLGFMVGSAMDTLTGHWQWGVRITAIFGVIALILIIFFIREPERGLAERQNGQIATEIVATSYWDDIKYLATNATYVTSTIGYTATVFAVGSLAWWAPTCILYVQAWKNNPNSTYIDDATKNQTNILFGIITCAGGILGVVIGTMGSNLIQAGRGPFRFIKTPRADCIMCALGALIAAPTLIIAMHTMKTNMTIAWISLFICVTAASFNWAIDVNILLTVVIPSRRSSASSWQILLSHLFGDASGPYILGLISDTIRGSDDTPLGHFHSLVTSFYLCIGMLLISVVFYGISALTLVGDQKKFAVEMGVLEMESKEKVQPDGLDAQSDGLDDQSDGLDDQSDGLDTQSKGRKIAPTIDSQQSAWDKM